MLIDWIKEEEGFRSKPYKCTSGVLTFGHGLTFITEEESLHIVEARLDKIRDEVNSYLDERSISLDGYRINILCNMSYQLGFSGLLKFKKMFKALENMNYEEAANEMLDSKWHLDTPSRCKLNAERMRLGYDR